MLQICLIHFFVLYFWFPHFISISLSPCAKWNQTGVIILGIDNQSDTTINQLNYPQGIFVHKSSNTLYVADSSNHRIQSVSLNKSNGLIVTIISNVSYPANIYVNDEGNNTILYITSEDKEAVIRWVKGASSGEVLGAKCGNCFGLSVDNEQNIYTIDFNDSNGYYLQKWSPQTNNSIIIANNLSNPKGIYIDRNTQSLYVSERRENRVLIWSLDNLTSFTIVASKHQGSNVSDEIEPYGIRVDQTTKVLYVTDPLSRTIRRWKQFNTDIIIGSDQLDDPTDLDFDNDGNLYVSQTLAHNIKVFALIDNEPCPTTEKSMIIKINNSGISFHSDRYFNSILFVWILFLSKVI